MKSFLEGSGLSVAAFANGQEAWDHINQNPDDFDLVITDIEMPVMNGLELTRSIKGDPRLQHLPVIAVTSLSSGKDVERGYQAGIDDYQLKLDREALLEAIRLRVRNPEFIGAE